MIDLKCPFEDCPDNEDGFCHCPERGQKGCSPGNDTCTDGDYEEDYEEDSNEEEEADEDSDDEMLEEEA